MAALWNAIDDYDPEAVVAEVGTERGPRRCAPSRGDLIAPGHVRNYGKRKNAAYVYLTATLDAATWGAELAIGKGPGRIYTVEATGPIEDDPDLTNKKFRGNSTKSYRSFEPLRVTGAVTEWRGHSHEALKAMKDSVERLRRLDVENGRQ